MDNPAVAPVDPAPVVVSIANSDISPTDQSENIRSVLAFYEAALNQKDFDKAAKYLGSVYIQHNPGAEDGAEGFRKLVDMMKQKTRNRHSTILRAFGSGNYVILHVRVNNPDV
ncbi:hypothetical protein BL470_005331, partial [Escherichia coli]|nr:hypothetical protein [Escherichia coli]